MCRRLIPPPESSSCRLKNCLKIQVTFTTMRQKDVMFDRHLLQNAVHVNGYKRLPTTNDQRPNDQTTKRPNDQTTKRPNDQTTNDVVTLRQRRPLFFDLKEHTSNSKQPTANVQTKSKKHRNSISLIPRVRSHGTRYYTFRNYCSPRSRHRPFVTASQSQSQSTVLWGV